MDPHDIEMGMASLLGSALPQARRGRPMTQTQRARRQLWRTGRTVLRGVTKPLRQDPRETLRQLQNAMQYIGRQSYGPAVASVFDPSTLLGKRSAGENATYYGDHEHKKYKMDPLTMESYDQGDGTYDFNRLRNYSKYAAYLPQQMRLLYHSPKQVIVYDKHGLQYRVSSSGKVKYIQGTGSSYPGQNHYLPDLEANVAKVIAPLLRIAKVKKRRPNDASRYNNAHAVRGASRTKRLQVKRKLRKQNMEFVYDRIANGGTVSIGQKQKFFKIFNSIK